MYIHTFYGRSPRTTQPPASEQTTLAWRPCFCPCPSFSTADVMWDVGAMSQTAFLANTTKSSPDLTDLRVMGFSLVPSCLTCIPLHPSAHDLDGTLEIRR